MRLYLHAESEASRLAACGHRRGRCSVPVWTLPYYRTGGSYRSRLIGQRGPQLLHGRCAATASALSKLSWTVGFITGATYTMPPENGISFVAGSVVFSTRILTLVWLTQRRHQRCDILNTWGGCPLDYYPNTDQVPGAWALRCCATSRWPPLRTRRGLLQGTTSVRAYALFSPPNTTGRPADVTGAGCRRDHRHINLSLAHSS